MKFESVQSPDGPVLSKSIKSYKACVEHFFLEKTWQSDEEDALQIAILYFIHSFPFSITHDDFITKDSFLLVEFGNFETFPQGKLCFDAILESMEYQVYKRNSMYRCGGFP